MKFKTIKDYTLICNRCGWFSRFESRSESFLWRFIHRCVRIDEETNYGI